MLGTRTPSIRFWSAPDTLFDPSLEAMVGSDGVHGWDDQLEMLGFDALDPPLSGNSQNGEMVGPLGWEEIDRGWNERRDTKPPYHPCHLPEKFFFHSSACVS